MADIEIANRVKEVIKKSGGYEVVSQRSGLNIRTLTRITSGTTDPKLSNFLAIADATDSSINYLAFGINSNNEQSIEREITKLKEAMSLREQEMTEMAAVRSLLVQLLDDPNMANKIEGFDISPQKIKMKP